MDDTVIDDQREQLRKELSEHTIYELLGGEPGIRGIVDAFHDLMDLDDRYEPIRSMHAADLAPMRQGLFEFLSGWLGGPPLFVQRRGSPCLTDAHAPFTIGQQARDLWVDCMDRAMQRADVADRYRLALMPALSGMAEMMRNDPR